MSARIGRVGSLFLCCVLPVVRRVLTVVVPIGDGAVAMDFRSAKPTAFETVCTLAVEVLTIGPSSRNLQRQDADAAIDRAPA